MVNKFPYLLWNQKILYYDRKSWPLGPVLSHLNPVHIFIELRFAWNFL
jgi:hypothetical protein